MEMRKHWLEQVKLVFTDLFRETFKDEIVLCSGVGWWEDFLKCCFLFYCDRNAAARLVVSRQHLFKQRNNSNILLIISQIFHQFVRLHFISREINLKKQHHGCRGNPAGFTWSHTAFQNKSPSCLLYKFYHCCRNNKNVLKTFDIFIIYYLFI